MTKPISFTDQELDSTVGELPSVSGTSGSRFIQTCIRYYRDWYESHRDRVEKNQIPPDQALILIYSEAAELESFVPSGLKCDPKRVFKNSHTLEKGVATATENLTKIFQWAHAVNTADEAFYFILQNLTFEHVFVIILPSQKRALIHQDNEDLESWIDEPTSQIINIETAAVTPEAIDKQIRIFHENNTRTPNCWTARFMWNDKVNPVAFHDRAEERIQLSMLTHFSAWLDSNSALTLIDEEVPNPGGRLDIRIVSTTSSKKFSIYILELKVIRPSDSKTKCQSWAISGVVQAKQYLNQNTNADTGFACIFDARKDKTEIIKGLEEKAKLLDIRLSLNEMELPTTKVKKIAKNPKGDRNNE